MDLETVKNGRAGGWYVFRCDSHPKHQLLAASAVKSAGWNVYNPTHTDWRWSNKFTKARRRKVPQEYPLFPGYIFIRMSMLHIGPFFACKPDSIWRVLSDNGWPYRVPWPDMRRLIAEHGQGDHIAPDHYRYIDTHHEFDEGDEVEIVQGPFSEAYTDLAIKVEEIRGSNAILELDVLGGLRKVPVPLGDLRKAS